MEHDVSACVVGHAAAHGEVLEIGACGRALDNEHIAAAYAFEGVGFAETVVPRSLGHSVGEHGKVTILPYYRSVGGFEIGAGVAILLAVAAGGGAFGGYHIVALHYEYSETCGGVLAIVGRIEGLTKRAVTRHYEIIQLL